MESYPVGKSSFARQVVSASVANVASFLTLRVATASYAFNAPGPSGSSGSSYTSTGITGPQGPTGSTGPTGFGVYLLSSSIVSCSYSFNLGQAVPPGTESDACNATQNTYYSNVSSLGLNVGIYTDVRRTTSPSAGYYSNGTTVWSFDGGLIDNSGNTCTGGGDGDGGGGAGCTGTCTDGFGCAEGCYCSTVEGIGTCSDTPPGA